MIQIPLDLVVSFMLVFVRVFLFLSFMPVYGDIFMPARVRALTAIAISLVFAPLLHLNPALMPDTLPRFFLFFFPEAILGMALGFVGRLIFASVQFAGTLIGEQVGFGMASILDPTQAGQMPVVGQTLFLATLLVFLGINGDQYFFSALAGTFEQVPPGLLLLPDSLGAFFTQRASEMFILAVQLSMPIIIAIFAANVGLVMLGKGIPTLHLLIESFPIRIMLGLFVLSLTSVFFIQTIVEQMEVMRRNLKELMELIV